MQYGRLTEKVRRELIEYAFNVAYLMLVFTAFTQYRRFLLAEYSITYTNYWLGLFGALVLGKVIMIGGIFRLGRGLEDKPLIFPNLYKTVVFTVFCAVFKIVEFGLKGVVSGPGFMGGIDLLLARDSHELGANSLMVFVAFVPFFGVKELGRVLGEKTIRTLFFRPRTGP